ncbi:MAG: general stress protein CsbD [Bacteroidetes bacterium]|nr:MAG: general stress protein CsbD [Bacteroidota bacterium]
METLQFNRTISWEEKKKKLKKIFPAITDNDLHFNDGKEKVMIEMLAYKLGITTNELRYIIHGVL